MNRRFSSLVAALVAAGALAATLIGPTGASGAPTATMPTITLTMTGKSITVGGTPLSGAVNVSSTVTGVGQAEPTLFRLNPGASFQQAFAAAAAHHGDPNYLDPYGSIVFDAPAPAGTSTAQTVLAPGRYVALDTAGNNPSQWPTAQFTVAPNPHPAALPAASQSETAIEFGFRGNKTLHDGQLTRFENGGFLVHMIVAVRAKNHKAAKKIVKLLKRGKDHKAQRLAKGFEGFAGPLSSGGLQQFTLNAKPGYWVLVCFMNAQDGREHTRLGMERIVKIVG